MVLGFLLSFVHVKSATIYGPSNTLYSMTFKGIIKDIVKLDQGDSDMSFFIGQFEKVRQIIQFCSPLFLPVILAALHGPCPIHHVDLLLFLLQASKTFRLYITMVPDRVISVPVFAYSGQLVLVSTP